MQVISKYAQQQYTCKNIGNTACVSASLNINYTGTECDYSQVKSLKCHTYWAEVNCSTEYYFLCWLTLCLLLLQALNICQKTMNMPSTSTVTKQCIIKWKSADTLLLYIEQTDSNCYNNLCAEYFCLNKVNNFSITDVW